MGRYTLRRLLQLIPVILGTTFLIHFLVWNLPGDPFAGRCGERPCNPAYIERMTELYNLNDPLIIQYGKYLLNLLQGNFGEDFRGVPVAETMAEVWPNTVKLAVVALSIEIIIGIGAGVLTGLKRGGFLDNLVMISTLFLMSLPVFVIGYLLQLTLGLQLGIIRPTVSPEMPWSELIVPGFVLASLQVAFTARLTRASIAENMRADYVRTAVAKGLPRRRVVGVHLLRNSLIPAVTFLGTEVGALMAGAIVTEGIFNINGVGQTIYRGIITHDATAVVPMVTVLVLVYLLATLLVDLLYAVLDPRIRYE
ncbi:ABC transporter permease [Bailinhaonella thermotolerans]|uniref:ABC transporter permease n=1 Tax=Bailinhaonella thermotolerans TaxID=1070861 RepID=A0A3A4B475_9ACTN|nr:ABC transporter permease [Bailinhaonella thermotolerans]RJL33117.1 ABC transporter permease [Bailinhaonella thermotolerans]